MMGTRTPASVILILLFVIIRQTMTVSASLVFPSVFNVSLEKLISRKGASSDALSISNATQILDWKPTEVSGVTYDFNYKVRQNRPVCPPPTGVCSSPTCLQDKDCPGGYLCCFNGCLRTCLVAVDPPALLDWEEESPSGPLSPLGRSQSKVSVRGSSSSGPRLGVRLHSHSPPEMVALSGGCLLTPIQFRHLEDFQRGGHVNRCFCSGGGVLCEVNAARR